MYWTIATSSGVAGTTVVTTSGNWDWGGWAPQWPTTIKDVCDTLAIHKHKEAQVVFNFQELNNRDAFLTAVMKLLLTKIDFKSSSLYCPYKDLVTDISIPSSFDYITVTNKLVSWLKTYHYGDLNLMYLHVVNGYATFKLGRFTKPSTKERILKHMGYIR